MGEPIPPDPGVFETGAECEWCTYGEYPIFEPDNTPKYVQVDVYVGDAIQQTFILIQSETYPCNWSFFVVEGIRVRWENYFGPLGVTNLRIAWTDEEGLHRSFNTFPPAIHKCATGVSNVEESEDRFGDYATITWNASINEAAYEAQFE